MPKHLFPGFKQNRTSTKESRDDKETEDDEGIKLFIFN